MNINLASGITYFVAGLALLAIGAMRFNLASKMMAIDPSYLHRRPQLVLSIVLTFASGISGCSFGAGLIIGMHL